MATYIYARTSTDEQNVEQQVNLLTSKYPHHDYVVTEQFTGTTLDRPKFDKLLKKLQRGDTLIVREISRLGRNAADVLTLANDFKLQGITLTVENLGVDLTTPAGEMMLTVMAGCAQMEKQLLAERQRIGIERAKKEGKYTGRKALDSTVVDTAKKLIAGGMSKAATARQLNIGESTLYRYLKS